MDDLRYQVDLLTALNQKLQAEERMYKLFFDTSLRAFLYVNNENGSAQTLGCFNTFFDFSITEAARLTDLEDYFSEESREDLRRLIFVEKEGKHRQALDLKLKDEKTWVCVDVTVFLNDAGEPVEKIFSFTDVTKQKKHQEELSYMAYYDFATGLYNRNYFITRLKDYVDKAQEHNMVVSVMLIDIDDFHHISDSKGLVTGDEVIQNLGLFIHDLTEENVIASRFDSDIFCIGIYDPCGHRSVDTIYRSIKEYLSKPMKLTDMTDESVSVSVGVAEYPESADNALSLINCAEIVMYKAKKHGKDNIKFFDTAILNSFLKEVSIENKLKEAVSGTGFFMNYQPQFYAKNKRLRGVEALLRWKDSDGNLISPSLFIPLAERNKTILSIGDFVLNESIRQFMEWKKKFDLNVILSVNISSIQYHKSDFVPKVMATLNKYGMNPELLELEVTESVLIDDFKSIVDKMLELRDYGVRISLDNFGSGFSSLAFLRGLPINTLKIDKSFIDNILRDDASKIVVESLISMAEKLGFETVAEGVETKEQYDYLTENTGCNLIQGYYLSKPTDEAGIEELMLRII
ncbi:MAG: bifunctional diguanylate cyclase/phosphodiesterase [Lachnospiraceae bacterium]|nr:bifunctional diguanylate cyclase/phosphodiesterase [Lachnospiraceae bacterium]